MSGTAEPADSDGPLPAVIPVFPLHRVLLLPQGLLPLNIFEPRYLAMTRDALAGNQLIGMIQPQESAMHAPRPQLYRTGCVGRIVAANETDNGRILITLKGICRFNVTAEIDTTTPYRQVQADYAPFSDDRENDGERKADRERLLKALRGYLERQNLPADWAAIEAAPNEALVHSLAMICPFSAGEKQALLESPDFAHRAQLLITLLEMALLERPDGAGRRLN